ncbi:MAG TPA: hypothetical protein V6C65_08600 [Allocoleopsis sp.]
MDYRIEQTGDFEYTFYTGFKLNEPYMAMQKNLTSKRWEVFDIRTKENTPKMGIFSRKQDAIDFMIACWEDYKIQEEEQTKEDTAKWPKPYRVFCSEETGKAFEQSFENLGDAENWARACKKELNVRFLVYYRSTQNDEVWTEHKPACRRVDHFPEIEMKSGKNIKEMPEIDRHFLCKRTSTLWKVEKIISGQVFISSVLGEKLVSAVPLWQLLKYYIPVFPTKSATDMHPRCYLGYREIWQRHFVKGLKNADIPSTSDTPMIVGAALAKKHIREGKTNLSNLRE